MARQANDVAGADLVAKLDERFETEYPFFERVRRLEFGVEFGIGGFEFKNISGAARVFELAILRFAQVAQTKNEFDIGIAVLGRANAAEDIEIETGPRIE